MTTERSEIEAACRVLMFRVGDKRFGIPLSLVVEVLEVEESPIAVPGAPDWVRGVINHHGKVVTVIGMGKVFGWIEEPASRQVILLDVSGERIGAAVDRIESLEDVPLDTASQDNGSPARRCWYRGELLEIIDADMLTAVIDRKLVARHAGTGK